MKDGGEKHREETFLFRIKNSYTDDIYSPALCLRCGLWTAPSHSEKV